MKCNSTKSIPRDSNFSGGYFKAPNLTFDLPLSGDAKLILLYLCRRADRKGFSFPSLGRIAKDCSIKSRTTVSKALKELYEAGLVVKVGTNGTHNTYQLSNRILSILRSCSSDEQPTPNKDHIPVHEMNNTCSSNGHLPVHEMDTKEYTSKENTHKEILCVLNKVQLDEIEKEWHEIFFSTHDRQTTESPKWIRENLILIAQKISEKLGKSTTGEIYDHALGLIKWYLKADAELDPSRGNQ